MRWLNAAEMTQLLCSAFGIFISIIGGILRLTSVITREQFYNIAFVAIILFAAIPFFIEYIKEIDE